MAERKEHDLTTRFRAEEYYVEERLTFDEVAEKTKVAVSTLKRWAAEGDWRAAREEHLQSQLALKRSLAKLRRTLIKTATDNPDPQNVYAVIRLEKLAAEQRRRREDGAAPDIDRPRLFLEDLEFIVKVLEEINPEGLKVLLSSYDVIIKRFKREHEKTA